MVDLDYVKRWGIAMKFSFPKFVSSDHELNVTYNYRCELYQRHIKKVPSGYVITEFLPDVPWAGIYNTISCAASHHFREGRWLCDTAPLVDYAHFWCNEGNPRLYSFPIADSVLALSKVTGDPAVGIALYPKLKEIHDAWDDHKTDCGMYTQLCDRDGMELSISGDGIRPTINSYMYADKMALALLAEKVGDQASAEIFRSQAEVLRKDINARLWNDNIGMFGVISEEGEKRNVREQVGYIPWMYGIPYEGKDGCFTYLLDKTCFLAPCGLRTADASHPEYRKHFNHECLWNGPVWPFATSQTLTALIAYLQTQQQTTITADDFMSLLLTYAYSQRDTDGTPWLDENMDPDKGIWLAREILRKQADYELKDRGRHYNHSTFIDLVMTGICGICPSEGNKLTIRPLGTCLDFFTASDIRYHGHTLSVQWDKRAGLCVTVDGNKAYDCAASDNTALVITL